MPKIPRIIPVSDLRADAATALKSAKLANSPIIITQRGRATAVLMSIEAYEQLERERAILKEIARGERELRKGRGHALEDVLQEMDEIIDAGE
jgi:prevent-host-death family protein